MNLLNATIKRGPWSASEDAILMEAMKKHGSQWEEIAKLIDGRTGGQCRGRMLRQDFQIKYYEYLNK